MLTYLIRNWNPFFFTPLDPRPIAVFRILSGGLLCCMMMASLPNWHRFLAADGIISLHSIDLNNTRVNGSLGLMYWTEGILPIQAWWLIGMTLSVTFTIGWHTRLSTIGVWLFIESMLHRNPYLANGEEMVLSMCILYLVFVNIGAVWSVDSWLMKRRGKPQTTELPSWPIRMMQINVAMVYAISLPYKLVQDPGWVTGDALHWTVASDMWGPSQYPWITLAFGGLLRKVMTFGTVFAEGFFPLAVWFRPTRRIAIFLIASLHLGIAVLIPNVTYFTLSMVCAFAAFLTKEDFEVIQKWCHQISNACRAIGRWETLPAGTALNRKCEDQAWEGGRFGTISWIRFDLSPSRTAQLEEIYHSGIYNDFSKHSDSNHATAFRKKVIHSCQPRRRGDRRNDDASVWSTYLWRRCAEGWIDRLWRARHGRCNSSVDGG